MLQDSFWNYNSGSLSCAWCRKVCTSLNKSTSLIFKYFFKTDGKSVSQNENTVPTTILYDNTFRLRTVTYRLKRKDRLEQDRVILGMLYKFGPRIFRQLDFFSLIMIYILRTKRKKKNKINWFSKTRRH